MLRKVKSDTISLARSIDIREAVMLARYQLRLLDRWTFAIMLLAYLGCGMLLWTEVQSAGVRSLQDAADLSRFALEPGAGIFAGVLFSSMLVSDPLLEITMATPTGITGVAMQRLVLTFSIAVVCFAAYMAWSLVNGVTYAGQQNWLYVVLVWLVPMLVMSMLGMFGSLVTRNAALGMVVAIIPLAASLFLYGALLPINIAHLFLLTYTYSGGQDAPDWWTNRLTLLGVAVVLAVLNLWLLRREERLLGSTR